MASAKELRKQIGSIKNTQKITSAMEMVAASKMRKAQERMARGRPYSDYIRSVIGHVANASPEYRHSFMKERDVKRVGYIVVTTDKGLCGGLNVNLLKAVVADLKKFSEEQIEYDLCLIGNKGAQFFRSYGGNVTAASRLSPSMKTLSSLRTFGTPSPASPVNIFSVKLRRGLLSTTSFFVSGDHCLTLLNLCNCLKSPSADTIIISSY